ncbi:ribonuclease P [Bacteroidales bacterium Barb7]|nr:ribonuclease P [Bacteroidales bacterium Barb4]OAV75334.1 ribonuclease P [Bacteroidales bacterium Barb7]
MTPRYSLTKAERLSHKRDTDLLFAGGRSFIAFPLRVVYLIVDKAFFPPRAGILISVAKKRFKRAVKRNYIKRQVREAYRTQKNELTAPLEETGKSLMIAFLYVDNEIRSHQEMEKAMTKALRILREKLL